MGEGLRIEKIVWIQGALSSGLSGEGVEKNFEASKNPKPLTADIIHPRTEEQCTVHNTDPWVYIRGELFEASEVSFISVLHGEVGKALKDVGIVENNMEITV